MRRLAIFLALCATPAAAHQAPTGWVYPWQCCAGQDCRHAEPGEIVEQGGGFFVPNTGELIPYGSDRIRPSRDNDTHICQRPGSDKRLFTPCIFLPSGV